MFNKLLIKKEIVLTSRRCRRFIIKIVLVEAITLILLILAI